MVVVDDPVHHNLRQGLLIPPAPMGDRISYGQSVVPGAKAIASIAGRAVPPAGYLSAE